MCLCDDESAVRSGMLGYGIEWVVGHDEGMGVNDVARVWDVEGMTCGCWVYYRVDDGIVCWDVMWVMLMVWLLVFIT